MKFKRILLTSLVAFSMVFNFGTSCAFADDNISAEESNVTDNRITWLPQNVEYYDDNYGWTQDQQGGGFHNGLAVVYYDAGGEDWNNFGYIDENGEVVIPLKYYYASAYVDDIAGVCIKSKDESGNTTYKSYYLNKNNERLTQFDKFDSIREFYNGFAVFKDNEKYGFINTKGEIVIPAIYDDVKEFSEGKCFVKSGEIWTCMDETGKEIYSLPTNYTPIAYYSEGKIGIYIADKGYVDDYGYVFTKYTYCYFDENGNKIFDAGSYSFYSNHFKNNRAVLINDNDENGDRLVYSVVDETGNVIVEKGVYDYISNFRGGYALAEKYKNSVNDTNMYYIIDVNGNVVCEVDNQEYKNICLYNDYTNDRFLLEAINKDGLSGAINEKGEIVIPFEFDKIGTLNENKAFVQKGDLWGIYYLDESDIPDKPNILGDTNGDGVITVEDSSLLLQKVLDKNIKIGNSEENLDVDGNKRLTSTDVAIIYQKAKNSDFIMPVEEKEN